MDASETLPVMTTSDRSLRGQRVLEFVLLFLLAPPLVGRFVNPLYFLPVLWAVALGVWLFMRRQPVDNRMAAARDNPVTHRRELRRIALRLAGSAVIVTAGVWYWMPERFLRFPREKPRVWLAVMVLYPLLSVYQQELIYRKFFFWRFRALFPRDWMLVLASTVVFSWVHVIFHNPYAIGLTLAGGYFFAETWRRTGSMRLVCLEHALYGCLVFTLGLGEFFL